MKLCLLCSTHSDVEQSPKTAARCMFCLTSGSRLLQYHTTTHSALSDINSSSPLRDPADQRDLPSSAHAGGNWSFGPPAPQQQHILEKLPQIPAYCLPPLLLYTASPSTWGCLHCDLDLFRVEGNLKKEAGKKKKKHAPLWRTDEVRD